MRLFRMSRRLAKLMNLRGQKSWCAGSARQISTIRVDPISIMMSVTGTIDFTHGSSRLHRGQEMSVAMSTDSPT